MAETPMDVLIVGAGPVGLTLAAACQQQGLKFRLVERAAEPTKVSKALAVWTGTLELLAALGLAETFIANARQLRGLRLTDHGKPVGFMPVEEGVESRYAWPILLPQSRTEALLTAHLRAAGVALERQVELVGLQQDKDGVRCRLAGPVGRTEDITAAYVAGCDGARSFVRHQLPVQFEGETVESNFILADAKIVGDGPSPHEVFVSWSDPGPVAIFPVEADVFRVFSARATMENQEPPTLAEIQARLDAAGLARWKLYDPIWLSYFQVNERVASRMRVGRVFLCGDAAHIHSPVGGQGMNTGMQDAYNLAWKLKVLCGGAADPEAVAESYQTERHGVARAVVGGTSKMLRAGLIKNPVLRKVRGLAAGFLTQLPMVHRLAAGKLSELSIVYADSPLVDNRGAWPKDAGGILPGWRARDVAVQTVAGVGASLWKRTFASDYVLLYFSGHEPAPEREGLGGELAAVAAGLRPGVKVIGLWHGYAPPGGAGASARVEWLRDAAATAHERYGVGAAAAWYLVRPDQYVAARSQPADAAALRRALAPVAAR